MILADLFHPGRDGAGALYTLEHYEAIKDKLRNAADGSPGIACQWLPLHLMDIGTMKIIMRTFLDVFPNAYLFLGNYDVHGMVLGLVGSEKPLRLNEDHFVNHFSDSNLTAFLKTIRYTEPLGFFHYFVAETDALRKYVGEGPLNTDNRPIVTWKAPAVSAYDDQKDGGPKMRLKSFLEAMRGLRGDTLDFIIDGSGNRSDGFSDRKILSIVKARDLFLLGRIEAEITSWNKCAQMFLEALSLYPEYDAVYDNLLEMCRRAYRRHPQSVHAWLTGLMQVSPQRPEAQELYARIFQPETMR
jgi:spermidine synthase